MKNFFVSKTLFQTMLASTWQLLIKKFVFPILWLKCKKKISIFLKTSIWDNYKAIYFLLWINVKTLQKRQKQKKMQTEWVLRLSEKLMDVKSKNRKKAIKNSEQLNNFVQSLTVTNGGSQ